MGSYCEIDFRVSQSCYQCIVICFLPPVCRLKSALTIHMISVAVVVADLLATLVVVALTITNGN